jgi:hypothetical protein
MRPPKRIILVVVVIGAVSQIGQNQQGQVAQTSPSAPPSPPAYVIPPTGTASLVGGVAVSRNAEGGLIVTGNVALPPGTKIWVENIDPKTGANLGQDDVIIQPGGSFTSDSFTHGDSAWSAGPGRIEITAMFNSSWQTPDVQAQIGGESGAKLPQSALVPDDPEFPNGARHLDEFYALTFPPLSDQAKAIEHVKLATLSTPDGGTSSAPVGQVINYYIQADNGATKGLSWTATEQAGKWDVACTYIDAQQQKTANWEYDSVTKKVRYLDPNAKLLSWLPSN